LAHLASGVERVVEWVELVEELLGVCARNTDELAVGEADLALDVIFGAGRLLSRVAVPVQHGRLPLSGQEEDRAVEVAVYVRVAEQLSHEVVDLRVLAQRVRPGIMERLRGARSSELSMRRGRHLKPLQVFFRELGPEKLRDDLFAILWVLDMKLAPALRLEIEHVFIAVWELPEEPLHHLAHHFADVDFLLQGNTDDAVRVIELLHLRRGTGVAKSVDVEDALEDGRFRACHAREVCLTSSELLPCGLRGRASPVPMPAIEERGTS